MNLLLIPAKPLGQFLLIYPDCFFRSMLGDFHFEHSAAFQPKEKPFLD